MVGAMNQLTRKHMRIVFQVGIVLAALLTSSLGVPADDVPVLDVQPICRGIASQAANPTEKGGPDLTFSKCVKSEQTIRDQISIGRPSHRPIKDIAFRLATQGGEPSYTELILASRWHGTSENCVLRTTQKALISRSIPIDSASLPEPQLG